MIPRHSTTIITALTDQLRRDQGPGNQQPLGQNLPALLWLGCRGPQ